MAVSCLEQRLTPLTDAVPAYAPWGPFGMPPSLEEAELEEQDQELLCPWAAAARKGRRCKTWGGYVPHAMIDANEESPMNAPTPGDEPSLNPSFSEFRSEDMPGGGPDFRGLNMGDMPNGGPAFRSLNMEDMPNGGPAFRSLNMEDTQHFEDFDIEDMPGPRPAFMALNMEDIPSTHPAFTSLNLEDVPPRHAGLGAYDPSRLEAPPQEPPVRGGVAFQDKQQARHSGLGAYEPNSREGAPARHPGLGAFERNGARETYQDVPAPRHPGVIAFEQNGPFETSGRDAAPQQRFQDAPAPRHPGVVGFEQSGHFEPAGPFEGGRDAAPQQRFQDAPSRAGLATFDIDGRQASLQDLAWRSREHFQAARREAPVRRPGLLPANGQPVREVYQDDFSGKDQSTPTTMAGSEPGSESRFGTDHFIPGGPVYIHSMTSRTGQGQSNAPAPFMPNSYSNDAPHRRAPEVQNPYPQDVPNRFAPEAPNNRFAQSGPMNNHFAAMSLAQSLNSPYPGQNAGPQAPPMLPMRQSQNHNQWQGGPQQPNGWVVTDTKAAAIDYGVTTLMVQNVPRHINQRQFLAEVDRKGFADLYNYCHLPMAFDTGSNKGFAFINLNEADVAQSFHASFNGCLSFGNQPLEKALRVVKAEVQGFNANAAKAMSKKTRRIRNSNFKPVLGGGQPEGAVPQQPQPANPNMVPNALEPWAAGMRQ